MNSISKTKARTFGLALALVAPTAAQIYDAGPIVTNPTGGFALAPISELENAVPMSLNAFGFNANRTANFSIADDFTVCGTWTTSDLEFFAYQTGGTTPTITGVFVRIWNKDPRSIGAVSVFPGGFGNPWSANLIGGLPVFDSYRVLASTPLAVTREVQRIKVPVVVTLTAGVYWMEVQFTGGVFPGPFVPPVTKLGCRTTGDAIHNSTTNAAGTWTLINHSGTLAPAGVALPFRVYGTVIGGSVANASSYGIGKLGTNGIGAWNLGSPIHQPVLGSVLPLTVVNGVTGSMPIVLLGSSACSFALPCATLLVCPPFLEFVLPPFDTSFESMGHIQIPHGTNYCGLTAYLQAFWADSGATCGYGHSNGLQLTLGN